MRKKGLIKKLVILLLLTLCIGGLLITSLIFSEDEQIISENLLVYSETIYIILLLAIVLPVVLIVMMVGLIKRKPEIDDIREVKEVVDKTMPLIDLEHASTINTDGIGIFEESKESKKKNRKNKNKKGQEMGFPKSGSQIVQSVDKAVEPVDPKEKEEEEKVEADSRFYMLTKIDHEMKRYRKPIYDNEISLEEVCESFRNFSSCQLGLYYDIKDIRRFIAGLAVTHLMILQGMSGTGKTSLAYAFGEYLRNSTVVIPIQPMWKERSDLIGYYNEFTKKFNETVLLQKLYEANYNDEIYITVLDELNIARIEYYFAEFLSLLELPNPEKRYLDVVADEWKNDPKLFKNGQLRLPKNMWFIGTANNDDSTFAISDKVYDRAMVINLDTKARPFDVANAESVKVSASRLEELYKKAQKEYSLSKRNLSRIRQLDKYLIDHFHITFGNRIMKQIKSYVPVMVACGGTELDAIDDILSKKVLRKLEAKNPVYVRSASAGLIAFIEELFGQGKMPQCKDYIETIEQNA